MVDKAADSDTLGMPQTGSSMQFMVDKTSDSDALGMPKTGSHNAFSQRTAL